MPLVVAVPALVLMCVPMVVMSMHPLDADDPVVVPMTDQAP